jgi:polysaccharide biosynthesis/export protein
MHRRHRITKISSKQYKLVAARFSYLLGVMVFGLIYSVGFVSGTLAQNPTLPQPQENPVPAPDNEIPPTTPTPQTQPLPSQSPSPTFQRGDIPPRTSEPSTYQQRDSRSLRTYRLDIGDVISGNVQDFPEFSFSGSIDTDGNIFVPILGKVPVVGLTVEEVEAKVAYELGRRFLKEEPIVIASLISARAVQLTLLGEVVRPGFYNLPPGSTLTSVLLSAGGATSKADLRAIVVRRPLVDGTVLEERVDLYTPLLKGQRLPDFVIQGGDTIIISRLEFGQEQGYDRNLIARTNLVQPTITVRVLAPNANASGISLRNLSIPSGSTFLDVVANLPSTDTLRVNFDEVALLRFDQERGRIVNQTLSPTNAVEGDVAQNIPLQDQDVIVVSRTVIGEVLSAFRTLTQPVRDVFGFSSFILDIPDRVGF